MQLVAGGAILDLLSHDLDQALALFGTPHSVRAESLGEVDTARCTLQYADGFQAVVEGGWFAPEVEFSASFELRASDGSLLFRDGVLREGERVFDLPEQDGLPRRDRLLCRVLPDPQAAGPLPAVCVR